MDITGKYRAKVPPKEHEEAVRMLLEGIATTKTRSLKRGIDQRKPSHERRTSTGTNSYDCSDRGSLNHSTNSKSMSSLSKSKTTSTAEDSMMSSVELDEIEDSQTNGYKEPIPSRTIAVQCDLKLSSVKRDQPAFDASMQASSISSTKYGFYNYTPEILEQRRKLQQEYLQIDQDDLDQEQNDDRELQQQISAPKQTNENQIEAPTSMSELSSPSCLSDDGNRTATARYRSKIACQDSSLSRNGKYHSSSAYRLNERPLNSNGPIYKDTAARTKLQSLPRRPMTALSYVSTTRLRDSGETFEDSSSCDDDRDAKESNSISKSNRAYSQQVLSGRRSATPANITNLMSSSDSEISHSNNNYNFYNNTNSANNNNNNIDDNLNEDSMKHSEEILLVKGKPMVQRQPTMVQHTERIEPLNNVDDLKKFNQARLMMKTASLSRTNLNRNRRPSNMRSRETKDFTSTAQYNDNYTNDNPVRSIARDNYNNEFEIDDNDYGNNDHEHCRITKSENRQANIMSTLSKRTPLGNRLQPVDHRDVHLPTKIRASTLSKNDRAYNNQTLSSRSQQPNEMHPRSATLVRDFASRSNVRRQVNELHNSDQFKNYSQREEDVEEGDIENEPCQNGYNDGKARNFRMISNNESDGVDSESPSTRTWANPSTLLSNQAPKLIDQTRNNYRTDEAKLLMDRKSSRSQSMRNVNNLPTGNYYDNRTGAAHRQKRNYRYGDYLSSDSSSILEDSQHFVRSCPRDSDAHRLNEARLPDIGDSSNLNGNRRPSGSMSYIGLPMTQPSSGRNQYEDFLDQQACQQITGRAMSQQSLSRPTMPLSGGRRTKRGAYNSNSGSDVGGSSMSLVSRLHGRYENAHTRSPVIMYIPQVTPKPASLINGLESSGKTKSSSSLFGNKSSTLRKSVKSSTLKKSPSSQEKLRRSANNSRNGSDSDVSSSMLRTLVRPRNRKVHSSKRVARDSHHHHNDDEDMDGIGQLATEMDNFEFRRRYSVPKNAKINWFAKLKQKVI